MFSFFPLFFFFDSRHWNKIKRQQEEKRLTTFIWKKFHEEEKRILFFHNNLFILIIFIRRRAWRRGWTENFAIRSFEHHSFIFANLTHRHVVPSKRKKSTIKKDIYPTRKSTNHSSIQVKACRWAKMRMSRTAWNRKRRDVEHFSWLERS